MTQPNGRTSGDGQPDRMRSGSSYDLVQTPAQIDPTAEIGVSRISSRFWSIKSLTGREAEFNISAHAHRHSIFNCRVKSDFMSSLNSFLRQPIRQSAHDPDTPDFTLCCEDDVQNYSSFYSVAERLFRVFSSLFVEYCRPVRRSSVAPRYSADRQKILSPSLCSAPDELRSGCVLRIRYRKIDHIGSRFG